MTSAIVERQPDTLPKEQIDRQIIRRSVACESGCLEFAGHLNHGGYGVVRMNGRTLLAHRAVWMSSHGPIGHRLEVCHRCDNPRCVNIEHLFVGDRLANQHDMYRKGRGRKAHGETHPCAKLTAEQVRQIRVAKQDGWTYRQLMALYPVTKGTLSAIVTGRKWKGEASA